MIANNYEESSKKLIDAEFKMLNDEVGQKMTEELLKMKLQANPNLSADEWEKTKQEFAIYLFYQCLLETPELKEEFAEHLYNELRSRQ